MIVFPCRSVVCRGDLGDLERVLLLRLLSDRREERLSLSGLRSLEVLALRGLLPRELLLREPRLPDTSVRLLPLGEGDLRESLRDIGGLPLRESVFLGEFPALERLSGSKLPIVASVGVVKLLVSKYELIDGFSSSAMVIGGSTLGGDFMGGGRMGGGKNGRLPGRL